MGKDLHTLCSNSNNEYEEHDEDAYDGTIYCFTPRHANLYFREDHPYTMGDLRDMMNELNLEEDNCEDEIKVLCIVMLLLAKSSCTYIYVRYD